MMQPPTVGSPGAPAAATPSLATVPQQGSALGGSPAGLSGSSDPRAILQKAELLMRSGAISKQQYDMIMAKLMGGAQGGASQPPAGRPQGMPPAPMAMPAPTHGGPMPSPQWGA